MIQYRNKNCCSGYTVNYIGVINVASDFPETASVGDAFLIGDDVTDNDPAKTNTGQQFKKQDNCIIFGSDSVWHQFQVIEAEQEADTRWSCHLVDANIYFTMLNDDPDPLKVFSNIYELNT